jgi:phosphoribosylanthranilate isomerase
VGLKICGMKYPENIIEVGSLHLIIWVYILGKSARYFDSVIPELPKSIKKVGGL